MKYRRYTDDVRPAEMDPVIPTPEGLPEFQVTCRRARSTAGGLTVRVRAKDAEDAMRKVREGEIPGIGLGWRPVRAIPV